jgi:hypothetical protein
MKQGQYGDPGRHLKHAIKYILVPEKTGDGLYVSAVNCQVSGAYEQMKATKVQFGKTEGRQGYHIIISFEEGEVDAPRAFEIVGKFVNEYLRDEYQAVYAVHDNTDHIHGHIVFNSVNFVTGKKYRYKKGDWAKYMQPITNRLCEEYSLSTISIDNDAAEPSESYTEWRDSKDGKFVWSDMIKRDLDACVLQADDFDEFVALLQGKGYEVKQNKYFAIKPPRLTRFRRCYRFGDDYTEERLRERIATEDLKCYQQNHSEARIVKVIVPYRLKRAKLTGIQRKYFAKLYRIGRLKQRPYSQAYKYRDEIRKMHKLHAQYMFLSKYEIHSVDDLHAVYENLQEKKSVKTKIRNRHYKQRAKFNMLFNMFDRLSELTPAEITFQNGDEFFEREHQEYIHIVNEIKDEGYTVDELKTLKEHYKEQTVLLREDAKEINKEIGIAKSLIAEAEQDNISEIRRDEVKRQPIR